MFDIVIKNGNILDGTGAPPFIGDVAVSKGKIQAVGKVNDNAAEQIDASGCMVSPGFIDCHSHSDFSLLVNGRAESKVRQGITTEVIGNCGESAAPVTRDNLDLIKDKSHTDQMNINWNWLGMADYLSRIRQQGISVNMVPLIGHNTLRASVMGIADREPSPREMRQMKALIETAMDEGARGMSTGLIYAPGCYAKTPELIELAKTVGKKGGIYATHMRSESDALIEGVKEALEIGEKSGIRVQISHHKAIGQRNFGKVEQTLAMMDQANRAGQDVAADQYPYTATSTSLTSALPYWMLEGTVQALITRLKNNDIRNRLKKEMKLRPDYFTNTFLSFCENHPQFEGMNIETLAENLKTDPFSAVFDILIMENGNVEMVSFGMSEKDVSTVMQHPMVMFGTDAQALADYGPLSVGKPHPRSYGTFPRILRKYVKEEKVISLEEAVRKMTSLPADRLGLTGRGRIQKGFFADITIFNFDRIKDKADFSDPHQYPDGIETVIVNGKTVIRKQKHTGALPGTAL